MFIWLRGTLPRLRYDQFMQFGWKFLIPVSIGWIMVVSSARALRSNVQWDSSSTFTRIGLPLAGLLAVWAVVDEIRSRRNKKAVATPDEPFDAFAGGHPVPPMPGQIAPSRVMQQPTQGPTQEVTGV